MQFFFFPFCLTIDCHQAAMLLGKIFEWLSKHLLQPQMKMTYHRLHANSCKALKLSMCICGGLSKSQTAPKGKAKYAYPELRCATQEVENTLNQSFCRLCFRLRFGGSYDPSI